MASRNAIGTNSAWRRPHTRRSGHKPLVRDAGLPRVKTKVCPESGVDAVQLPQSDTHPRAAGWPQLASYRR